MTLHLPTGAVPIIGASNDAAASVGDDAFIVGRTRTWTRDEVVGVHLWMNADHVNIVTIYSRNREHGTSYAYYDHASAKADYDRIIEGAEKQVRLQGYGDADNVRRITEIMLAAHGGAPRMTVAPRLTGR